MSKLWGKEGEMHLSGLIRRDCPELLRARAFFLSIFSSHSFFCD